VAYDINDKDLAAYLFKNERPRVDMRKQKYRGRDPSVGRDAGHGVLGGVPLIQSIYDVLLARGAIQAWYSVESLSALADGAAVTTWADKGPNGYTMATDGADPVYIAKMQGDNLPAVYFDETVNKRLKGPAAAFQVDIDQTSTLLTVMRKTNIQSSNGCVPCAIEAVPYATTRLWQPAVFDGFSFGGAIGRGYTVGAQSGHFSVGGVIYPESEVTGQEAWEVHTTSNDGTNPGNGANWVTHYGARYAVGTQVLEGNGALSTMLPGQPSWLGTQSPNRLPMYLREVILCVPRLSDADQRALHLAAAAKWRTI